MIEYTCDVCKQRIYDPKQRIVLKYTQGEDLEETLDLHEKCFKVLLYQAQHDADTWTKLP